MTTQVVNHVGECLLGMFYFGQVDPLTSTRNIQLALHFLDFKAGEVVWETLNTTGLATYGI